MLIVLGAKPASVTKESCHNVDDFLCSSGECIRSIFVCDNKSDCLDSSDEDNCGKMLDSLKYIETIFPIKFI